MWKGSWNLFKGPSESPDRVVETILRFGRKSWASANWEILIRSLIPDLGILPLAVTEAEAVNRAATALRNRYPKFTKSAAAWRDKAWDSTDANEIGDIVRNAINSQRSSSLTRFQVPEVTAAARSHAEHLDLDVWCKWQPFLNRAFVPNGPGLYMFGRFSANVPQSPTPFDERVVYIGMTEDQSLVGRLKQFENSWKGGTGHSGAFTLRCLLQQVAEEELLSGHTLYVSWMKILNQQVIRQREKQFLIEYAARYSRRPCANSAF